MAQEAEATTSPRVDPTKLALERTFLAHERTMMAWVRTAMSLITLGFTLFKFFEYLAVNEPGRAQRWVLGPRTYGMLMIVAGIVTLALATWQHRRGMSRLRQEFPEAPFSLALVLAAWISALGILALVATIYRG